MAEWNQQNTLIFSEVCVHVVLKGMRSATHFTLAGWVHIVNLFKEKSGCDYNNDQRNIDAPDHWWAEKI